MEQYRMVYMSVFYRQNEWSRLFKELSIIISENDDDLIMTNLVVFLNKHRGDNVRISFPIQLGNKYGLQTMVNRILHFLKLNPSRCLAEKQEITSLFADVPNNTVRFNLFNSTLNSSTQDDYLRVLISRTLLHYGSSTTLNELGIQHFMKWIEAIYMSALFSDCLKILPVTSVSSGNSLDKIKMGIACPGPIELRDCWIPKEVRNSLSGVAWTLRMYLVEMINSGISKHVICRKFNTILASHFPA